jgi:hypothetical protein
LNAALPFTMAAHPTTVVNVRVAHIRPQFADLRAWCADPHNVYVGRGGVVMLADPVTGMRARYPPKSSPFANPFKVDPDDPDGRAKAIARYEVWVRAEVASGRLDLEALCGKNLGCWCSPLSCHADVLVVLVRIAAKPEASIAAKTEASIAAETEASIAAKTEASA